MANSRPDLARPAQAPRRPTVLVVDDDPSLRDTMEVLLRGHGYRILKAESGPSALETIRRHRVDVAFLDIHLGKDMDGFDVLGQIRSRFPDVEAIMCSIDRDVQSAVRAIKVGAFDYLTKDFGSLARAPELVEKALIKQGAQREMVVQRSDATRALDCGMVVGKSPKMRDLVEVVAKVAPAPATVLIHGESGTGKELLARLVHRW